MSRYSRGLLPVVQIAADGVDAVADAVDGVVDLVGQARGQAPDGRQAFGVPDLVLGRQQVPAGLVDPLLHAVEMLVEDADLVAAVGQAREWSATVEVHGVHGRDQGLQRTEDPAQHQPQQQQHDRGHRGGEQGQLDEAAADLAADRIGLHRQHQDAPAAFAGAHGQDGFQNPGPSSAVW